MNSNQQMLISYRDIPPCELGPVDASASVMAHKIVAEIISPGMTVENGSVVITATAIHRLAHALVGFVERGGRLAEELEALS